MGHVVSDSDYLALRAFKLTEFQFTEEVFWRQNDKNPDQLDVYVDCSDVFAWGISDVEQITEDNIDILEETINQANTLKDGVAELYSESRELNQQLRQLNENSENHESEISDIKNRLSELRKQIEEEDFHDYWTTFLFTARSRRLPVQDALAKDIPKVLVPLFEEAASKGE